MERVELLDIYLAKHHKKVFKWGSNDCCTFSCDWVEEVTGRDIKQFTGEYSTEEEAKALLEEFGGRDKAEKLFGREVHPAMAQYGDIVCGDVGYGDAFGICIGMQSVFLGIKTLVYKNTLHMKRAWRV